MQRIRTTIKSGSGPLTVTLMAGLVVLILISLGIAVNVRRSHYPKPMVVTPNALGISLPNQPPEPESSMRVQDVEAGRIICINFADTKLPLETILVLTNPAPNLAIGSGDYFLGTSPAGSMTPVAPQEFSAADLALEPIQAGPGVPTPDVGHWYGALYVTPGWCPSDEPSQLA